MNDPLDDELDQLRRDHGLYEQPEPWAEFLISLLGLAMFIGLVAAFSYMIAMWLVA